MPQIAPLNDELVDAAAVAGYLGCARSWVYENANWLGARPLPKRPPTKRRHRGVRMESFRGSEKSQPA
jgi:hypothetical protein